MTTNGDGPQITVEQFLYYLYDCIEDRDPYPHSEFKSEYGIELPYPELEPMKEDHLIVTLGPNRFRITAEKLPD